MQPDAGAPHDARGREDDAGEQGVAFADAGLPPLWVPFNLKAFSDCKYVASSLTVSYPQGLYDVAGQGACVHPYTTHLLVSSTWQSDEPDQLLDIDSATITLKARGTPIQFGIDQLPNPFEATTHLSLPSAVGDASLGVAACEVIPAAYMQALKIFTGKSIVASIQLHALTSSREPIEATPFEYPIQICENCLTICGSDFKAQNVPRHVFFQDICDDNSGNDDRSCIDPDC